MYPCATCGGIGRICAPWGETTGRTVECPDCRGLGWAIELERARAIIAAAVAIDDEAPRSYNSDWQADGVGPVRMVRLIQLRKAVRE
jgi:DnaJ-class molecular chaperone